VVSKTLQTRLFTTCAKADKQTDKKVTKTQQNSSTDAFTITYQHNSENYYLLLKSYTRYMKEKNNAHLTIVDKCKLITRKKAERRCSITKRAK